MRRIVALAGISLFLFAACGGGGDAGSASNSAGGQGEAEATVSVGSTDHGDALVGENGRTLYMFEPDQEKNGTPTCYDECADAWPALEATDGPTAGNGLDESKLGTAERTDGGTQVTYNDLPLYYFSGDEAAGDTNGQGLNDVWWVVSAAGEPIRGDKAGSRDDSNSDDGY